MGRDSGYGFGWKFLAGSLTAYNSGWVTVHHYTFTDSTGAEYRLTKNSNGIWYSKESIYVRYDPVKNQMYFPDGSFWEFGALSSGIEEDAGTIYPTKMQDINGNQILITCQTGTYAIEPQSSSRISAIEDARSIGSTTFQFTYSSETSPHLTNIASIPSIGIGYTFTMAGTALNSPFESDSSTFGTTRRLDTITGAFGLQHQMTYHGNNSGELTKVAFPYGGSLACQCGTDIYWATDSEGNPYIATTYAIADIATSTQINAGTDQTSDNYGNLTQMKVYDYSNLSTPVRTYNNTYVTDSNYTSRYINNLLASSSVTPAGAAAILLATNYSFRIDFQSLKADCAC